MNVLDEIVANRRLEIAAAKAAHPLEALIAEAENFKPQRRPFKSLFQREEGILIAEIKPKSPSAGKIINDSPLDVAEVYAESAADIISVLTDEKYFGGSLELLKQVRARVPQAILRKDFIIDGYQVYETLLSGADAYLLIASVLRTEELRDLIGMGTALGLDTLVEVHDEADVEKALDAGAELLGINNRDLQTLDVDLAMTERLMRRIPAGLPVVSESGIETPAQARQVRAWGVRGILVGTSILQSSDPLDKINQLKQALK